MNTTSRVAILSLAIGLNLALLVSIAAGNPKYLSDYRLNANPDASHYVLLGENVWNGHGYARQRVGATPLLAIFAGVGVIWTLDSARRGRLRYA